MHGTVGGVHQSFGDPLNHVYVSPCMEQWAVSISHLEIHRTVGDVHQSFLQSVAGASLLISHRANHRGPAGGSSLTSTTRSQQGPAPVAVTWSSWLTPLTS